MIKKISFLICISIIIICIDQMTKTYIQMNFAMHDTKIILNHFFNITYARNYGAAFGFLEQSHTVFRDFVMLTIPPIAALIILVLVYYVKTESDQPRNMIIQLVALSLIFGGAIGNYIDRLQYGYVIDFFDIHWYSSYSFPIFNIADTAIVIGAALLIFAIAKEKKHEANS